MQEDTPERAAPTKAVVLAKADKGEKPAKAEPKKLTPAEHAAASGRVRASQAQVVVNGAPINGNPFKGDHRAASRQHSWGNYPGFKLSRADYEAAIAAAKKLETHAPAVPGVSEA